MLVEGTDLDTTHREETLFTLAYFDNPQGLQGLLQYLALAEAKREKHPPQNPDVFPTRDYIRQCLTQEGKPERIAHWREVIAAQPCKGLPPTHQQFLDSIAAAPQRL